MGSVVVSEQRKYNYDLAELIDRLTINQIKVAKLGNAKRSLYIEESKKICEDIDLILDNKDMNVSGCVMPIVYMALMNLQVWDNKDKMLAVLEDEKAYMSLLDYAQDMNSLRNHMKNTLLKIASEDKPSALRSAFLNHEESKWYTPILSSIRQTL